MKLGAALVALLTGTFVSNGQAAQSLRPADFVVSGLGLGADTATVLRIMGRPDSTHADSGFGLDEHARLNWYFPDGHVSFFASPRTVEGIALRSPHLATARGLRVSDTRARVRELYGLPLGSPAAADIWVYGDNPAAPDRLIIIKFAGDKVVFIHVRHFRA
jgi:hypothetical protein